MAKPASGTPLNTGHALATSLEAAWGFLEGSGATSADATGNGYTATFDGATWGTSSGDAVAVNASNTDPAPLTVPALSLGGQDWSVAWRAESDAADNAGVIVGDAGSLNTNEFIFRTATIVRFRDAGAVEVDITHTDPVAVNDYVMTYTNSTRSVSLYVDGVLIGSQTLASGTGSWDINALMGGHNSATPQFSFVGDLHYMYVWDGRVLSLSDAQSLNSDPYQFFSFEIAITSPEAYQTAQHSGGSASVTVSGTYTGSPTSIEYRHDGGDWAVLDASPTGGTFSGSISLNRGDQGTLEVRHSDNTSVTDSVAFVGCGEVFAVFGQSNASGRGANNRTYSHATLKAGQYTGNGWQELADPIDADANVLDSVASGDSAGGHWAHKMCTDLMASLNVPIGILVVAKGGEGITQFTPGADRLDRTTFYGSLNFHCSAIGGVAAVLWWQGETDALAAMTQATYNGHLDTLANAIQTDFGVPLIACLLQNSSGITDGDEQAIRDAVTEAVGDNSNVLAGPDFSAIGSDDSFHFTTNTKVDDAGASWATSIFSELLPTVTLTEPSSIVLTGEVETLQWTTLGVTAVDVELSTDGGSNYTAIDSSNTGTSYAWTPATSQLSSNARIRVVDASDAAVSDVSGTVKVATTSEVGGGGTFPAVGDVLEGVVYGPGDTDFTGTYHAPSAAEVLDSAVFGVSSGTPGTYHAPEASEVIDTASFGVSSGTTGTVHLPDAGEVLDTAVFGASSGTAGTYHAPDVGEVLDSASFGVSSGTTGTYHAPEAGEVLDSAVFGVSSGTAGTYHAPDAAEVISTAVFGVLSGTAGTVVQATTTDVRSGVTYGPSSSLTGSLIVSGGNALSTDDINNLARAITKVTPRIKAASANEYELIIGDTFSQEIETVSATEFVFSIKSAASDPDADAILLISSLTGLEVVNGEAYGTAGHGSIVFAGGTATITVNSQVTDDLTAGDYVLTLKGLASGADKTWENAAKVSVVVGGVAEVTL